MAKQIIAEWNFLDLPQHEVRVSRSVNGRELVRASTLPGYRFNIRASEVERKCGGFTPDVLLHGQGDQMLAVEVCVTHRVHERKRAQVAGLTLPMIEYGLSGLRLNDWDLASLEVALRAMAADWVVHPLEASVRQKLEGELLKDEANLRREIESRMVRSVDGASSGPALSPTRDARNSRLALPEAQTPRVTRFEWNGVPIWVSLSSTAVVWVCTCDLTAQARMMAHLEADAKGFGLRMGDVIRTPGHGVLIPSGVGAIGWAEMLEGRLAGRYSVDFQAEDQIT